jgi:hypothetical protein
MAKDKKEKKSKRSHSPTSEDERSRKSTHQPRDRSHDPTSRRHSSVPPVTTTTPTTSSSQTTSRVAASQEMTSKASSPTTTTTSKTVPPSPIGSPSNALAVIHPADVSYDPLHVARYDDDIWPTYSEQEGDDDDDDDDAEASPIRPPTLDERNVSQLLPTQRLPSLTVVQETVPTIPQFDMQAMLKAMQQQADESNRKFQQQLLLAVDAKLAGTTTTSSGSLTTTTSTTSTTSSPTTTTTSYRTKPTVSFAPTLTRTGSHLDSVDLTINPSPRAYPYQYHQTTEDLSRPPPGFHRKEKTTSRHDDVTTSQPKPTTYDAYSQDLQAYDSWLTTTSVPSTTTATSSMTKQTGIGAIPRVVSVRSAPTDPRLAPRTDPPQYEQYDQFQLPPQPQRQEVLTSEFTTSSKPVETNVQRTTSYNDVQRRPTYDVQPTSYNVPVDEHKVIDYFYKYTYPVKEVADHYRISEDQILFPEQVNQEIRPWAVKVNDQALDLTSCDNNLWRAAINRFRAYIQGGFRSHDETVPKPKHRPQPDIDSDHDRDFPSYTDSETENEDQDRDDSDKESIDTQMKELLSEAPTKSDSKLLKDARVILRSWDEDFRLVSSLSSPMKPTEGNSDASESELPEPPASEACLPPHPRVSKWYHFAQAKMAKNVKYAKPGMAVHLDVTKRASKLFCVGKKAKHLHSERNLPTRFDKVSYIKDDTKMKKLRALTLPVSAPMTRVMEALVRTGTSTASHEISFISALQTKMHEVWNAIDNIKSKARDKKEHYPPVLLKEISNMASDLIESSQDIKKVFEAAYLAADIGIAAWTSLDFNLTLSQRDRFIAKLLPHMKFAAPGLRQAPVESSELFPNAVDVVSSSDGEFQRYSHQNLMNYLFEKKKGPKRKDQSYSFGGKSGGRGKGRGKGARNKSSFRDSSSNSKEAYSGNYNSSYNNSNNNNSGTSYRGRGRGKDRYASGSKPSGFDKSKSK